MTLKEFVRDFCDFSRRDRIAILSLIILCSIVWCIPSLLPSRKNHIVIADSILNSREFRVKRLDSNNFQLFYFDPNTLDVNGWIQLGVREKTALTIQKYISKGGKFRKKEDLKKIWGLSAEDYDRIAPYVTIEQEKYYSKSFYKYDTITKPVYKKYTPSYSTIDINLADTTAFIALPGIGSKLAIRIIAFREKLGGFYSVEQVGEVYGLQDSTFQKIKKWLKVENLSLKKININTATNEELKVHPYIRWNLAKLIVAYRTEHGAFNNIDELKNIMAVTEEIFKKIKPYLEL